LSPYAPHDDELVTLDQIAAVAPMVNYQRYFNTDRAEKDIDADLEGFVDIVFRKGDPKKGGLTIEMLAAITPENSIFDYAKPFNMPKSDLMSDAEVAEYVKFYRSIGVFNGPLQWYRTRDQDFHAFAGKDKTLNFKTLFLRAEFDAFSAEPFLVPLKTFIKDLTIKDIANAGHWWVFVVEMGK
jgi:hypothetical protein